VTVYYVLLGWPCWCGSLIIRRVDPVGIECELHVVEVAVSGLAAYRKLLQSPLTGGCPYLGFTAIEAWRMDSDARTWLPSAPTALEMRWLDVTSHMSNMRRALAVHD